MILNEEKTQSGVKSSSRGGGVTLYCCSPVAPDDGKICVWVLFPNNVFVRSRSSVTRGWKKDVENTR